MQLEDLHNLLGPSQLSSTASPQAPLLLPLDHDWDILELGQDPRDEALSPQLSSRQRHIRSHSMPTEVHPEQPKTN